ncbi:MAG: hypothetical protein KatS3mg024_1790 [Armatimonadota bacterium]|nr:MAG: hypothetical protein KatS3mg024_1790 [Armatimonadota bacterium]
MPGGPTLEEEVRRAREMSDGVAAKLADCEEELARHESGARGLAEDKAAQRSRLESCRARMRQLEEEATALLRRQAELEERRGQRSAEAGEASGCRRWPGGAPADSGPRTGAGALGGRAACCKPA